MPQQFGQKDYTDIDRLRDIIGRVSHADLNARLFVADQERTKAERSKISDVLDSYSRAISGKRRSDQMVRNPQFGGLQGMQSIEEPISPGDEASEASKAVAHLAAIGGPEAKQATSSLIEMRKGNISEEERTLDRRLKASMFNESMMLKTTTEAERVAEAKVRGEQGARKLDIEEQKNLITDRHNKAMENLKSSAGNSLQWDKNGKITVNPNAKPAEILKLLPQFANAISTGMMRAGFVDPSDTTSRQAITGSVQQLQDVYGQITDLVTKGLSPAEAETKPKRIKVKLKNDVAGHKAGTVLEIDEADYDANDPDLEKVEDAGNKK